MLSSSSRVAKSLVSVVLKNHFQLGKKASQLETCYRSFHGTRIVSISSSPVLSFADRPSKSDPPSNKKAKVVEIWHGMGPRELAKSSGLTIEQVRELMDLCNIKWINSVEDIKTMLTKLRYRFTIVTAPSKVVKESEDNISELIEQSREPEGKDLKPRPPIVTIMGHVDHGKTTLLDSLRHSQIVEQEFGGITQHIGAFAVALDESISRMKKFDASLVKKIVTFLDTPGHAAFSAMRQRGANVTDIVVLVIAADDGVMEQTIESIKYAQKAGVPMIIAVNKIDKVSNADEALKRIRMQLNVEGIVTEADGGDVQVVTISALKGEGLRELKEAILALAETLELKSSYDGGIVGSVVESKIDPHRGKMATVLVNQGILKKGSYILAGEVSYCRVRAMFDEQTRPIETTTPGFASQVIGWRDDDLPEAGDIVYSFPDEKSLRQIVKKAHEVRMKQKALYDAAEAAKKNAALREEYTTKRQARIEAKIPFWYTKYKGPKVKTYQDDPDELYKLRLCIKADVHGSAEVLLDIIDAYPNDTSPIKLDLLHYGVGAVTENDIELAACFQNSVVYAFNVPISPQLLNLAKESKVKIKTYNVIYHFVDDLIRSINEMMPEKDDEVVIGEALVQKQFLIEEKRKSIPVAGCRCTRGPILREDCFYKVVRNNKTVADGLIISSMKHLKEDVKSINTNLECGLKFSNLPENFNFLPSDILVCYKLKKVKPTCKWRPPGF
ncbi:translation initiation factor IF-2, mitochondrial [Tetranychus urticae]|uniref:translation initiation factor IF-2, mitochondrial n=1 Tax=Tetranychus urticae TaxID=32264 RepID=UPI000D658547|nr:translation initiation factor IF-2, mitochondrial [Tetranychus urticae]